jgi:hypothetical protein
MTAKEFEDWKVICVFIGKIGRLEATYKANQRFTPNCGLMDAIIRRLRKNKREKSLAGLDAAFERSSPVTQMLAAAERGDASAEELLPLICEESRRLAAARLVRERPGQTLQATRPRSTKHGCVWLAANRNIGKARDIFSPRQPRPCQGFSSKMQGGSRFLANSRSCSYGEFKQTIAMASPSVILKVGCQGRWPTLTSVLLT